MIDPNLWNTHGTSALFALPVAMIVWIWKQVNGIGELKIRIAIIETKIVSLEEKIDVLISMQNKRRK